MLCYYLRWGFFISVFIYFFTSILKCNIMVCDYTFSSSMFNDVTSVVWNQPCSEYLYQGNQWTLQSGLLFLNSQLSNICQDTTVFKKMWKYTGHQKDIKQVLARIQRNWNPHTLPVGMYNGLSALENNLAVPQKVKRRITTWSSSTVPRLSTWEKWKDIPTQKPIHKCP